MFLMHCLNLGKYADTLVLIKEILNIYLILISLPTSITVSNILNNIDRDIPYTDIGEAFNRISKTIHKPYSLQIVIL